MFHRKKQNVTEVKGGHWSCKVDICRLTLIPRSFTKNSRSYQMPTAPSLSLSWTILKTFAHFLKPSFIHFVWDAICLSVTLQLTTVRGVFLFAEKKTMLSAVRNNRESGVASRLKLKVADEATKQMKWNNQILMLPKKSKHSYKVIPLNLTFQL